MLNIKEIEEEIMKLEECDCTTYDVCRKLAILYTVKNHYPQKSSTVAPTTRTNTPTSSPMMSMPTV